MCFIYLEHGIVLLRICSVSNIYMHFVSPFLSMVYHLLEYWLVMSSGSWLSYIKGITRLCSSHKEHGFGSTQVHDLATLPCQAPFQPTIMPFFPFSYTYTLAFYRNSKHKQEIRMLLLLSCSLSVLCVGLNQSLLVFAHLYAIKCSSFFRVYTLYSTL